MLPELEAAKSYSARGWSVLPMKMAEKTPAVRWRRYQSDRASDSTLRNWFCETDNGVAVVFGEVSGFLASRDFDDRDTYHDWAGKQPRLAAELPTVVTRRGFHVYATTTAESVQKARRRLGKAATAHGALTVNGGELRAGTGCYSVLPPSVHPRGHVYEWVKPPGETLPTIDVCEVDFFDLEASLCNSCNTSDASITSDSIYKGVGSLNDLSAQPSDIETVIAQTLPTGPGQRNRRVFLLARMLKSMPEHTDAKAADMRQVAKEWHRRAEPFITTKPFIETWADFQVAWEKVIPSPNGVISLAVAYEKASIDGLPDCIEDYGDPRALKLAGLCRVMQRGHGNRDDPFFLSCRSAAELLGVDHSTASRWLKSLVTDGVLELVHPGDRTKRQAATYRYKAEL